MKKILIMLTLSSFFCKAQENLRQPSPQKYSDSSQSLAKPSNLCLVGIFIKSIYELKPQEGAFSADLWVWVKYNHRSDTVHRIEFTNAKKVSFTDPHLNENSNHELVYDRSCGLTLIQDYRLKNYPFDRQCLSISLESQVDTSVMRLTSDTVDTNGDPNFQLPGWTIDTLYAKYSIVTYHSNFGLDSSAAYPSYSRVIYRIPIKRDGWGLFLKLVLGLYISFFVAYLSFFISPIKDTRYGLSIGALFAAVSNKYIVDNNIPESISFSFIDQVHVLTFTFILGTLILSLVSLKLSKDHHWSRGRRFDRKSAWVIGASYLSLNIALIIIAHLT